MLLLGSASALNRTIRCPASTFLAPPEEEQERSGALERAAARGTALHKYLDNQEVVPGYERECDAVPLEDTAGWYVPPIGCHEQAMVYSLETGKSRCVPVENGARDYGELTEDDVPGTADVLSGGYYVAEVWDYKTGRSPVPKPEENYQLLHLALMAKTGPFPKAEAIVVGLQTLKHSERTGRCTIKEQVAHLSTWQLQEFQLQLEQAAEQAREARELVRLGKEPKVKRGFFQCLFCPAKGTTCPAHPKKGLQSV